jgi:hypothetical protein
MWEDLINIHNLLKSAFIKRFRRKVYIHLEEPSYLNIHGVKYVNNSFLTSKFLWHKRYNKIIAINLDYIVVVIFESNKINKYGNIFIDQDISKS